MTRSYNAQDAKRVQTDNLRTQIAFKNVLHNPYGEIMKLEGGEQKLRELVNLMKNDTGQGARIVELLDWFKERGFDDDAIAEAVSILKGD